MPKSRLAATPVSASSTGDKFFLLTSTLEEFYTKKGISYLGDFSYLAFSAIFGVTVVVVGRLRPATTTVTPKIANQAQKRPLNSNLTQKIDIKCFFGS